MSFRLNGMYPTSSLWESWILVIVFEFLVIAMESFFIGYVMRNRVKTETDVSLLYGLVIVANILTFIVGVALQLLLIGA